MALDLSPSPIFYAKKLATYIKDPSTVRARTLDYWGTSPSVEQCRAMIEEAHRPSDPQAKTRATTFPCGHARNEQNDLIRETGNVVCKTCRNIQLADGAKRARERKRQEEKRQEREKALAELRKAAKNAKDVNVLPWPKWYQPPVRPNMISGIVGMVAAAYQLSPAEIMGKSRRAIFTRPRFMVCLLATEQGRSSSQIGRCMGGRDHTTILHAATRAGELIKSDPEFRAIIEECREYLRNSQSIAA